MIGVIKRVFGLSNEREIKRLNRRVNQINELEEEYSKLSDESLRAKTEEFKGKVANGETLDRILPHAFAVVREASKRVLGMRHFDVQLMGGITLHNGNIAEMRTGEGKTLVSTLPAYLNALSGQGVHIVTVNDYLARRDSELMGQIHRFLGLTVGLNVHGLTPAQKREAYHADITYGTNNEFGFDYLRDNMVLYREDLVQRRLNFAVIDEVDSILIDEARTPLIISGQANKSTELYALANRFVNSLRQESDFTVDIKTNTIVLTDEGVTKAEKAFRIDNLYDSSHIILNHHISQALRANIIMKRDVDYVVQDHEIVIVDEFTGRLMQGRRYSDGLHQAIEAKEGVKVQNESMTLATITLQNYFRMYKKLSGMTGTAKTEEEEIRKIYGLDVISIPTNRLMIRTDLPDVIYKTVRGKFRAVVNEIAERYNNGQPVLVGTISIENSELIGKMLEEKGIPHNVLNAKFHAVEAEIVAQAGQKAQVTIATNMAGRGTDIILGEGISDVGGLHIIGTERHESRRIDNQLRGRAGRQGDPGSSQFYLSLQDELMRRFGSENIMAMMDRLGIDEDQPIESKMVSRAIESAQKRVEGNNFDTRRIVLQYDDVMNQQREIIYKQRREVLERETLKPILLKMVSNYMERIVNNYCPKSDVPEEWNLAGLVDVLIATVIDSQDLTEKTIWGMDPEEMIEVLEEIVAKNYDAREQLIGEEQMREFEKVVLLRSVDSKWMEHIDSMEQLRQGIHLRAYAQTDPLREYQFEGFEMFENMIRSIEDEVAMHIMKAQVHQNLEREEVVKGQTITTNEAPPAPEKKKGAKPASSVPKVGRNEPCPCGSGKKYKFCHGA